MDYIDIGKRHAFSESWRPESITIFSSFPTPEGFSLPFKPVKPPASQAVRQQPSGLLYSYPEFSTRHKSEETFPLDMLPTRYGRLTVDHHRRRPVSRDSYLPALLDRKLRLDGPRSLVRHPRATYIAEPVDVSDSPRSLEEATDDLVKYINAHKNEISPEILRLRQCDMRNMKIARIVKQIFDFFDNYVFMNKLAGRVSFHGYAAYDDQLIIGINDSGKTIATFSGHQSADIILNSAAFQTLLETREVSVAQDLIIAAVLHQMIHAYFVVVCGVQSEEKKACELLSHNEHFGIVMYKIKQCSTTQRAPLPLDFGNTVPELAAWPGSRSKAYDTGGLTMRSSVWADERKTSTECARIVKALKEEECKDWYKNKCLKTLDPDVFVYSSNSRTFDEKPLSKCGSKGDWVEVTHKKKPYKVPRKAFDLYQTFKKKFEDSVRKLDVSSDVKKETFEEFVRFLCEDCEEYFPPSLRSSIEVYKLALSLKFEELKEAMMDAIYQTGIAHPNVEAILEVVRAVYGVPTQPDGPLRDWAVDFMKSMGGVAVRTATKDPRLSRLRSSSSAFKTDLSKAAHGIGPAALMSSGELCYSSQVARQMSPAPGAISSYTFAPPPTIMPNPPVQVTTTATQLPVGGYAAYHQIPYGVPATPLHPARYGPPAIGFDDTVFFERGPWQEQVPAWNPHPRYG